MLSGSELESLVPKAAKPRVRTEGDLTSLVGRIRKVLYEREMASGLTRGEFAESINWSRTNYTAIMVGEMNFRLSSVESIAKLLDVNIYELLGVPAETVRATPELSAVKTLQPT